mmetsp:Transcript_30298/g.30784  ORF Transcript_30298/g.30784 Transcript_30298/m.30784 type:complete len:100 (-) Transcript_30298:653-952(-)
MELSADDRVNMSLDDLIKVQKAPGKGDGKNRRRRGKGPGAATNPDKMEKNASQSIGASKAKRTATANQVFYHRSHLNFKSDGLLEGLIIKTNRKISVVD